jgi:hypothetical protein
MKIIKAEQAHTVTKSKMPKNSNHDVKSVEDVRETAGTKEDVSLQVALASKDSTLCNSK